MFTISTKGEDKPGEGENVDSFFRSRWLLFKGKRIPKLGSETTKCYLVNVNLE